MNQLDKEDGGLGFNAQGGDPEPESKSIKVDVDDPNSQHIKENQVDDGSCKPMEEALSDTSARETRHLVVIPLDCYFSTDSDSDVDDGSCKPMEEALADTSTHETRRVKFLPREISSDSDVDDGSCKPMEEAPADTSSQETRRVKSLPPEISSDSDDDDHEEARTRAREARTRAREARIILAMTKKWDRKLAKKGVDVEKLKKEKWADWQGKCEICSAVDTHPGDECLYNDFLFY